MPGYCWFFVRYFVFVRSWPSCQITLRRRNPPDQNGIRIVFVTATEDCKLITLLLSSSSNFLFKAATCCGGGAALEKVSFSAPFGSDPIKAEFSEIALVGSNNDALSCCYSCVSDYFLLLCTLKQIVSGGTITDPTIFCSYYMLARPTRHSFTLHVGVFLGRGSEFIPLRCGGGGGGGGIKRSSRRIKRKVKIARSLVVVVVSFFSFCGFCSVALFAAR